MLEKLRLWLQRRYLASSPKIDCFGIEVLDWEDRDAEMRKKVFGILHSALEDIHTHFPVGFRRIERSVRRVIVEYLPGVNGIYCAERRAAVVNEEVVLRDGAWQTALTIIHEATHAQIALKGFEYREEDRDQIERICRKRELAYIRCFEGQKDVDQWISWMQNRIEMKAQTTAELSDDHGRRLISKMRQQGLPSVLLQGLERFHERRIRRRYGAE